MKSRCLIRRLACLFAIAVTFLLAHRLPAPIIEAPSPTAGGSETPRAKPRPVVKPKPKISPVETSQPPATPIQNRFAGTWRGTMHWGMWGAVDVTLVIDALGTSVNETNRFTRGMRALTSNGTSVSWHEGGFGSTAWTLTSNADGKTAVVTVHFFLSFHDSAVFRKQ
jgi:hypothetical protein